MESHACPAHLHTDPHCTPPPQTHTPTHTHTHTGLSSGLSWVQGNAQELPFADACMDAYTVAFGIRNMTDRDAALSEAYRVLKRGGRLLCLEFSHVSLPVLKQAYDLYSFSVIPKIGGLVAGDEGSYQYLVESIRQFPDQVGCRCGVCWVCLRVW